MCHVSRCAFRQDGSLNRAGIRARATEMRTLTLALSGSSIRPHSRPRSSSLSPQRRECSSRTSVGHPRQLPSCVNDSLLRPFQQQSSSHPYVTDELRTSRNSGDNHMMEFKEIDKTCQHIGSYSGICTTNSLKHDRDPLSNIYGGLKLALLIGLVTYQGSQPALASTEFSGLTQFSTYIGDLGDISTGFASAFLLIFFSELGDKTFFIAALLAARNSGPVIFIGTFGALAAMSVISVILGRTFHYVDDILPFRFGETDFPVDDLAAACLLVYFGVSTLIEATTGDGLKIKEEQEEAEIAISELSGNGAGIMAAANTVFSTFLLVFVAEWGDKSFFSTIALAAASSPLGVIGGALAGHALATLLAVLGGSILGTFLSDKIVAYIGGSLFLVFAAVTLVDIVR